MPVNCTIMYQLFVVKNTIPKNDYTNSEFDLVKVEMYIVK